MKAGKEILTRGEIDLTPLDNAVNDLCTKLLYLMPDCTSKTLNSMRKKKLEHWDQNQQTNRDWLALNMMTEAKAGSEHLTKVHVKIEKWILSNFDKCWLKVTRGMTNYWMRFYRVDP